MNYKYNLDEILGEQYYGDSLRNKFYLKGDKISLRDNNFYLTETDFYPPSDDRVLESYIEDIDDGDNFSDYCKYIFNIYKKNGYYD